MSPFSIRLARADDIPALPDIERSAGKAFLDTEHAWVAGDGVTQVEAFPPRMVDEGVWVAEADGVLAGFALTEQRGESQHVLELAVHTEHQKKGIGRALMTAVADAARARGLQAVTLTTFRHVAFNGPFYLSLGYEVLETPPPALAAILADEAAVGLTDRCAMRLRLR